MKTKRLVWTVGFLGVTAVAIVMELIAGLWHPAGTIPWTEYLARYVPWPLQLVAYVALAVWLPIHFWHHDRIRAAGHAQGVMDEHAKHEELLYDAWSVIANACREDAPKEWVDAAYRWRDAYHAHLGELPGRRNA